MRLTLRDTDHETFWAETRRAQLDAGCNGLDVMASGPAR
jgi:hypothetical protein